MAKARGTCGVMVTASHNAAPDNGVKIIEPDGGMLIPSWEPITEKLVNAVDLVEEMKEVDFAQTKPTP